MSGQARHRAPGFRGRIARNAATSARPRNHTGSGGIASDASSVSIATTASTSHRSQASTYALDDRAQRRVAERPQRRLLAAVETALGERSVRPLERAVDRRGRRLERRRHLGAGQAEHVAQDQHRALAHRQLLERGDERELDALALLVAGLGRREPILEAHLAVGVRIDPHRLDERPAGTVVRVAGGRRSRSGALASAGARSPSGRRSSRSCRAMSAASSDPRTGAVRARRAAAPPGARPRHRARSRACDSSGRGAPPGAGRRARCRRPRRRAGRRRAGRARGRSSVAAASASRGLA